MKTRKYIGTKPKKLCRRKLFYTLEYKLRWSKKEKNIKHYTCFSISSLLLMHKDTFSPMFPPCCLTPSFSVNYRTIVKSWPVGAVHTSCPMSHSVPWPVCKVSQHWWRLVSEQGGPLIYLLFEGKTFLVIYITLNPFWPYLLMKLTENNGTFLLFSSKTVMFAYL